MTRIFQSLQNARKDVIENALGPLHAAGMHAWESTPPEERQRLMNDSMPVIQRLMDKAMSKTMPAPRPAGPADHGPELQRVLRELSGRLGASCLAEPELLVAERPRRPAAEKTTEALDELVSGLPGIGWREVSLPEAEGQRLGRPGALGKLAASVRFLDGLEWGTVMVEDPAARQLTTFRAVPVKQGEPDERVASFQRLYLLYSLIPSASRGTLDQRLDDLQARQFEVMGRMTQVELTHAIEGVVRQYGGADATSRKRMIGLPLTAMLLGTWFPRQAKEKGQ
jgi:hypothetical protein